MKEPIKEGNVLTLDELADILKNESRTVIGEINKESQENPIWKLYIYDISNERKSIVGNIVIQDYEPVFDLFHQTKTKLTIHTIGCYFM